MINKMAKKIIFIVMICLVIMGSGIVKNVYASSEEEQLLELLDQYKDNLGNLKELKQVIDTLYDDVNSATHVDDELKEKLNRDIDGLKNVTDINPLLQNTLEVELKSQIENLTDENLNDFKHEISVIKGWVDQQVSMEENNNNENTNNGTNEQPSGQENIVSGTIQNQNTANKVLPYAGGLVPVMGFIAVVLLANAIYAIIKYRRYKGF